MTCTSLPSLAGSILPASTLTTAPSPSASARAVSIARPSFQKMAAIEAMTRTSPTSAPTNELRMRWSQDLLVVSVKLSPAPLDKTSPRPEFCASLMLCRPPRRASPRYAADSADFTGDSDAP